MQSKTDQRLKEIEKLYYYFKELMENKVPISLISLIRTLNKYFNIIIMYDRTIANIIKIDENNVPVYYMGANHRIYPIRYTCNDKNMIYLTVGEKGLMGKNLYSLYLEGVNKHVDSIVDMKKDEVIITEIK